MLGRGVGEGLGDDDGVGDGVGAGVRVRVGGSALTPDYRPDAASPPPAVDPGYSRLFTSASTCASVAGV